MKRILNILIASIMVASCQGPQQYAGNTSCGSEFIFSQNPNYQFSSWQHEKLPGYNLEACLPAETVWALKDKETNPLFEETGGIQIMFPIDQDFWLHAARPYPHLSVILRKAKVPAESSLKQWAENSFSFMEEAKQKLKLSETCTQKEFEPPHFIAFDIGPEKLNQNDDMEFAKIRACKIGHTYYAVHFETSVFLIEQEGIYKLTGLNEELLLNIIRSIRPTQE